MSHPTRFKQIDITRAIRGAQAAGLTVLRVEIEPSGTIAIVTDPTTAATSGVNEWDDVFSER